MEGIGFSLFVYFHSFLITISIIQIEKSIDKVLKIRTRGHRMEGADKTMELRRPLFNHFYKSLNFRANEMTEGDHRNSQKHSVTHVSHICQFSPSNKYLKRFPLKYI